MFNFYMFPYVATSTWCNGIQAYLVKSLTTESLVRDSVGFSYYQHCVAFKLLLVNPYPAPKDHTHSFCLSLMKGLGLLPGVPKSGSVDVF